MTVQTFDSSDIISVTSAAATHFDKQLKKKGGKGVRISLKESGCTGFMYVIGEVDEPQVGDIEKKLDNGVLLYIDPQNIAALKGTVIDYQLQGINYNLLMNNPNVKDTCGCGESFSINS